MARSTRTTAETGRLGEDAAAEYLRQAGYELRERNWRSGSYEIDLIALRDCVLHIVEVKTRCAASLTAPEAAATPSKFRSLRRAALRYIACTGWEGDVQFDLMAVILSPDGTVRAELIENALECHW